MQMVFDILMLMPMFVCAFWSVVLALSVRRVRREGWRVDGRLSVGLRARRVLVVFMLVATVLYLAHAVYFARLAGAIPLTDTLYVAANLAVFPLYLLYIVALTAGWEGRGLSRSCWWWTLAPSLVFGVAAGCLYVAMDAAETRQFVDGYLYGGRCAGLTGLALAQAMVHQGARVTFALIVVIVLVAGGRMMRRHDLLVADNFADTEGRTLDDFRRLLVLFTVTSVVSIVVNAFGRFCFSGSVWTLALPSVLFSVLLFMVGLAGQARRITAGTLHDELRSDDGLPGADHLSSPAVACPVMPSFDDPSPCPTSAGDVDVPLVGGAPPENSASGSVASDPSSPTSGGVPASNVLSSLAADAVPPSGGQSAASAVAGESDKNLPAGARIIAALRAGDLYLKPDLKLPDLARRLGTNRTYLSQSIHDELGTSFSDLVNRMRIERAVAIMERKPDSKLADVASLTGYQSPTSFYRNFRAIMGCSPSDWRTCRGQAPCPRA